MPAESPAGWRAPLARGEPTSVAQLLWLGAIIIVAIAAHATALPAWIVAGLVLAWSWRLGAAIRRWPLPNAPLRAALTLAGFFAVMFSYRRISGVDAGSALLTLMLALKLLETRSFRDRSVVVVIAWFVLFTGFLREQSISSLPYLGGGVVIGTLALLQGARPGAPHPPTRGLAMTAALVLQALPLAAALFLLFPRLPGPFWALPTSGASAQTGLSDEMSPGDISSLALSDAAAFRVRFNGPAPSPAEFYWRGPVLESFDGRRWRAGPEAGRGRGFAASINEAAKAYEYEITLEPHRQRWLLPLETPLSWNQPDALLSGAAELLASRPVDRRMAWTGRSVPAGAFRSVDGPAERTRLIAASRNPRTQSLALDLRSRADSDAAYLQSVLRMFREQQFFYTLQPPLLGEQPVDDFLFVARAGFCEHYASAFALLARAAGIPSRIVTGYQGAEWNPIGGYWLVRQSAAHAWTEVWLDGQWVRFDPTSAVAPERIERGLDAALPGARGGDLPLLGASRFFNDLALRWDAANAAWDRWVLAFGPDQQAGLMRGLGIGRPTMRSLALLCAGTFGVLLLLLTVAGLRKERRRKDPLVRAWRQLCDRLAPAFRPRRPGEGPAEYAAAVVAARPDIAGRIDSICRDYIRLRYDGPAGATEIAAFRARVSAFRLPPAPAPG
jgi:transglutaminase-like putative cysteine protease